jgi:hypothetical protein
VCVFSCSRSPPVRRPLAQPCPSGPAALLWARAVETRVPARRVRESINRKSASVPLRALPDPGSRSESYMERRQAGRCIVIQPAAKGYVLASSGQERGASPFPACPHVQPTGPSASGVAAWDRPRSQPKSTVARRRRRNLGQHRVHTYIVSRDS